jgi:hypothetical protein
MAISPEDRTPDAVAYGKTYRREGREDLIERKPVAQKLQ